VQGYAYEAALAGAALLDMGHLLGTGLLTDDESAAVARRLVHPTMSSGFGLRTMSVTAAGIAQ